MGRKVWYCLGDFLCCMFSANVFFFGSYTVPAWEVRKFIGSKVFWEKDMLIPRRVHIVRTFQLGQTKLSCSHPYRKDQINDEGVHGNDETHLEFRLQESHGFHAYELYMELYCNHNPRY